MMKELGAPWTFGTDDPGSLLPAWDVAVAETAIVGTQLKRWPFPLAPAGVSGVPRSYLIEATKRAPSRSWSVPQARHRGMRRALLMVHPQCSEKIDDNREYFG